MVRGRMPARGAALIPAEKITLAPDGEENPLHLGLFICLTMLAMALKLHLGSHPNLDGDLPGFKHGHTQVKDARIEVVLAMLGPD